MPGGAVRILVVDDAAFTRQCVRKALEAAGYEVLEAASGEQAVDLYRALRSEVVVLDVVMPGMGGPAALTAIRELDGSARVIMLATPEQQPLALECLEAGAIDVVLKPIQAERVVGAVQRALAPE